MRNDVTPKKRSTLSRRPPWKTSQPSPTAPSSPPAAPASAAQPVKSSICVIRPHRNKTVSAPSRKTPVKAMSPTIQSWCEAWAASTRRWRAPRSSRACHPIHQPCHVSSATAPKITTRAMTSGPTSASGPLSRLTATPMTMDAATASAPPSVT